jgi:ATP-dependent Clp protease ATP-binding subunit ClpC
VIIFEPLTEADLMQIVDLMVKDVAKRLEEFTITLEITDAARAQLVHEGFDPVYGARPLRRTVQRQIENPLSKQLLAGAFHEGDTVRADWSAEGGYSFERVEALAPAAA